LNVRDGSESFPPAARLRRRREFDAVFAEGKSAADRLLVVHALENGSGRSRIGIITSARTGNAVCRNRIRRLVREAFRTSRPELPEGFDLVVIARRAAGGADFESIRMSLLETAAAAVGKCRNSPKK